MRKNGKIVLIISLNAMMFFGFLLIPGKAAEVYGWEYYNSSKYDTKIKFQTDATYVDTGGQGGVCPFGIWVYGSNGFGDGWWSTRILIKIYVTVEYEKHQIIPRRPPFRYWGPPPDGFLKWQGDYSYNPYTQGTWQWRIGVTYKYFSFSSAYSSGCASSWKAYNSISGDYRYLGWVYSRRSGEPHCFHALLKLHIDNEIAKEWAVGKYYTNGYEEGVEMIVNIRVWLKFYFQWELFGWHTDKTVNHILGDGVVLPSPGGGTDLNYIPLVEGTAGPIIW